MSGTKTEGMRRQVRWLLGMIILLLTVRGGCLRTYAASVSLNKTRIVLFVGEHAALQVQGSAKNVKWRSSSKKIAKVDKSGNVTAVKKGTARITAVAGRRKLTCFVTVKKNPVPGVLRKAGKIAAGTFSYTDRPGRKLIYTGIAEIDYLAEALVREIGIDGSWPDEKIVKKIYTYMSRYFYYMKDLHYLDDMPLYYDPDSLTDRIEAFRQVTEQAAAAGKISYTGKFTTGTWMGFSADGTVTTGEMSFDDISYHMATHEGVCDNHADVFSVLCCHLGIEAGIAGGSVSKNAHSWCWAKLGGKKYYFDIGNSIHYFHNTKKVTMGYFRMKKKKMKNYRFTVEY